MIWTLTHLKYFPVKRVVTNEIFSAQIFSDLILESFRQKKLNEKGQNSGNRQFFLNMRQSRPLFCVYFRPFRITIQVHKSWNKQRWCAWDLNPGLQNGWCSFGARHIFDTLSKFWYRGENSPPKSFSCFDQSTPTYNLKRLNFCSEPKFWVAGRENCCWLYEISFV